MSTVSAVSRESRPGILVDRYVVPPFSVLDARQGYWQARKRRWIAAGVGEALGESAGRRGGLTGSTIQDGSWQRKAGAKSGCINSHGTSVFDPVLCEIIYRWFAPPGGRVLDPFAGGPVRGIVAAALGCDYTGIDLRAEQVDANYAVAAGRERVPRWIVGDSADAAALAPGRYDLIFSCPPYADLERYSDDPRDLSAMAYPGFLDAYRRIIAAAAGMLEDNRFAVFVVGDVRDRKGLYRNLPGDTIRAFADAGLSLYNEAVLLTQAGSAAIRADGQFRRARKLVKTHQNVLVFLKGDPRAVPAELGAVEPPTLVTAA